MVFNDTSTKQGLIQDCEQLVFGNYGEISSNTNRLYDFTARMNRSVDKATAKIMKVDGRWQYDDSNYTDLPIGRTNIVSGQADYAVSVAHLEIIKVLVVDANGATKILKPLDERDPEAVQYLQNPDDTGTPEYYDKKGQTIFLYPKANYNATNGLIVHFKRGPSYFAYTDTTKTPGFVSLFHRFVSLDASLDYCISKQNPKAKSLSIQLADMERDMEEFYGKRSKDEKGILIPMVESNK